MANVVVSCEHATNHVPSPYRDALTMRDRPLLDSHEGYDRGALNVARSLAKRFDAPLVEGSVTRLLIDLNRREENRRRLFGSIAQRLASDERQRLVTDYHRPYRNGVVATVEEAMRHGGRVIFLSIHSFTPVMNGVDRKCDVAVLYDPARPEERRLADAILAPFVEKGLRARRNYPYRGVADGVATALRKRYAGDRLIPVEIELSHRLFDDGWTPTRLAQLATEGVTAFGG